MIRWETETPFGDRHSRSAWALCIHCGFALQLNLPAKMREFHVSDPYDLTNRLVCPCCNLRWARIVTLKIGSSTRESWKVLTRREEPPPPPPPPERLKFVIERENNSVLGQLCARLDTDTLGRETFKIEAERHPNIPLILRVGGHVLATHRWPVS